MWSRKSKVVVHINSWIKLYSKIQEWEWYKDGNTFRLFIHLLLNANWKDGKFKGIEIPRGSLVVGRKQLSEELQISEQSIRTSLNKLKSTNEITTKSTNKFTVVSVVNYEKYQQVKEKLTNELTNNSTNEQPTTNQQLTTIEDYKNIADIDNKDLSVCNNTHTREVICHLGSEYKTDNCVNCMKKKLCKLPTSPDFKMFHNFESFEEYDQERDRKYAEYVEQQKEKGQEYVPIFDYDWLNDTEEKDLYES